MLEQGLDVAAVMPNFSLDHQTQDEENQRVCEFCRCSRTPLWRRGPQGKRTLCNACGIRWSTKNKGPGKGAGDTDDISVDQNIALEFSLDQTVILPPIKKRRPSLTTTEDTEATPTEDELVTPTKPLVEEALQVSEEEPVGSPPADNVDAICTSPPIGQLSFDSEPETESASIAVNNVDTASGTTETLASPKGDVEKEQYYCKYCDTSWPHTHFRNAQQFGAHCSNCSRKRKVKEPQELTIRERNKRQRRNKANTPTSTPKTRPFSKTARMRAARERTSQPRFNASEHFSGETWEDDDNHFYSRDDERERRDNHHCKEGSVTDTSSDVWGDEDSSELEESALSALRSAKWKLHPSPSSSSSVSGDRSPRKRRNSGRSSPKVPNGNGRKGKTTCTSSASTSGATKRKRNNNNDNPEAIGELASLLSAVERKVSGERRKKELATARARVRALRREVAGQCEAGVEDLRFQAMGMVQELRIDMMARIEALRMELGHELAFHEARRRARLDDMRIQMSALQRILDASRQDREPVLLHFRSNCEPAFKQLEDLKLRMARELASREQMLQKQISELRGSYTVRLSNLKQQFADECSAREGQMQKELDDIKHTLHSVCSQIAIDNYPPGTPPTSSGSGDTDTSCASTGVNGEGISSYQNPSHLVVSGNMTSLTPPSSFGSRESLTTTTTTTTMTTITTGHLPTGVVSMPMGLPAYLPDPKSAKPSKPAVSGGAPQMPRASLTKPMVRPVGQVGPESLFSQPQVKIV